MLHLWRQKDQQKRPYALCGDILGLLAKVLSLIDVNFKFISQVQRFKTAKSKVNYLFISFAFIGLPHFVNQAVIKQHDCLLIDQAVL